jgi:hypothetical protein
MFRKFSVVLLIVAMLFVIGCAAHVHKVGEGAQGNDITMARQWYVLWGIVPINDVDTNAIAEGATDYEITTSVTPIDFVINAVLGNISINCRTVTVQK